LLDRIIANLLYFPPESEIEVIFIPSGMSSSVVKGASTEKGSKSHLQ